MTIHELQRMKASGKKISMVTSYDHWSAQMINRSTVDCVLVGDSAAMVMHGFPTTIPADAEMMTFHVRAVSRGSPDKLIVADMPFLAVRRGLSPAVETAGELVRAGAHAVKIEGVDGHEEVIRHLVESGIPVMSHLGLTPQSVHGLGGYLVQGKTKEDQDRLERQALKVQELGAFSLVLECVPSRAAAAITGLLAIPTIGIGAGPDVDGQVLVLHDLLGLLGTPQPRFVRRFLEGGPMILDALNRFDMAVKSLAFPSPEESYR